MVAAGRGQLVDTCYLRMCRRLIRLVAACARISQHTSAYVSIRQLLTVTLVTCACVRVLFTRLCSYCCRKERQAL
jgi:hypothetical protein